MRIVSLLASATEMIAELGCLEQLVGRSHECDYPAEVLTLPVVSKVQINVDASSAEIDAQIKHLAQQSEEHANPALKALSIYSIDVQQLQALRPDIIFTQTQCEVCAVNENDVKQAVQQLTGLKPQIVSLSPYRLSDVWEDILRVGQALGRDREAEKLVQNYQQRLARLGTLTTQLVGKAAGRRPRVAILEWLDPLMGAGNWTPELVAYAGGVNIFGELGRHAPWITWDDLQAANPEVLILAPCGFAPDRTMVDVPLLQKHPIWKTLQAVRTKRVYVIDGNQYLNRSGPRLIESAELIGQAVWGKRLGISAKNDEMRAVV